MTNNHSKYSEADQTVKDEIYFEKKQVKVCSWHILLWNKTKHNLTFCHRAYEQDRIK